MTLPLAGRRILLIGIGFYDYEAAIVNAMSALGAKAFLEYALPAGARTAIGRTFAPIAAGATVRHQRSILNRASTAIYDTVLVIKGDQLLPWFMPGIRARLPSARCVLYQWDSVNKVPGFAAARPWFDAIYSFDRKDCVRDPTLRFRPLFFRPGCGSDVRLGGTVDFLLLGWLHSDRLAIARELDAHCRSRNLRAKIHLYTGLISWARAAGTGDARFISVRRLGPAAVSDLLDGCSVVVDVTDPLQAGLSIRTIEALGKGKKLLTTNPEILSYDFYRAANIALLPGRRFVCPPDFLQRPYEPVAPEVRARYSLNSWILDVVSSA